MAATRDAGEREGERLAALDRLNAIPCDADHVLQGLVDDVRETFGTDLCAANLVFSESLVFRAWSGKLPEDLARTGRGPRERMVCRHVVVSAAPVVVGDFSCSAAFEDEPVFTDYGVRFYAGVPLVTEDGHAVGSLCLMKTEPVEFHEEHLELLEVFARAVVGRLETLGALEREREAKEEKASRARELERLARQQERILGSTGEGIVGLDPGGKIGFANPAAASMLGYEVREMIGRNMHRLVHHTRPDGSPYPLEECPNYLALREGEPCRTDGEVYWRKDGTPVPVEYASRPVIEGGDLMGAVVTFSDVGERRRAEEALRESERRFRQLFDQSVDALLVHDESGRMVDCNEQACHSLGYSREELLSLRIEDFATNLLREDEKKPGQGGTLWRRAVAGEPGAEGVHHGRHRRKDGTTFPVEVRVGGVDYGSRRMILASARDVTRRERAEEALKKSESGLAEAQRMAHLGNWELNVTTGEVRWSDEVFRIHGHAPGEFVPSLDSITKAIHPEDREPVRKTIDRALQDEREPYDFEHRVVRPDGEVRVVQCQGEVSFDDEGRPLRMVGTVHDVTERKLVEGALRESEERFRTLTDAALEALIISEQGRILEVNRAYTEMFGYEPSEVMGDSSLECIAPESRALARENLLSGHDEPYEVVALRKNGERFEAEIRGKASAYRGRAVRITAVRDITERKRAEKKLRESEERFRIMVEGVRDYAIFMLDSTGHIASWNEGARNIKGYEPGEIIGEHFSRFYPEEDVRRGKPERALEVALAEGQVEDEGWRVRRDGSRFWANVVITALRNDAGDLRGFSKVTRDITERKNARESLEKSEKRFRSLVQNASDLISVLGADGTVLYESPSLEWILGYAPEDLIGRNALDLIHPDDAPRVLRAFARLSHGTAGNLNVEYRFRHADGTWRHIESSGTNLLDEPSVGGIVVNSRDISERKELEEKLTHQALHDGLTGLSNRALFLDRLGRALERAGRDGARVAVLFLDLDDFKVVNDSLGHDAGDELLVAAAGRLKPCLRTGDTLARLGGDEFVVLQEGARGGGEAAGTATRIAEALREPFFLGGGEEVFVSASVGVAVGAMGEALPSDLLRRADMAMYEAKRKGKARHEVFETRMDVPALGRLRLAADLRRAVERGEFRVHYQPEISLETGRTVGFEALVRWEHPVHGLVPPARFVPVAEETGMIVPIGRWVLEEACRQSKEWREQRPNSPALSISVNLSARQFGHPDLVRDVAGALRETGVPPASLILEITESAAMENARSTIDTLQELKSLGVGLAIDDFGTGYSSLSYLRRFPVDYLKIDQSFVYGLGEGSGDVALVSGIVELAHALGLMVVAEGVETEGQLGLLRRMGCELAQGYLFAKPLPGEEAGSLLAREPDRAVGYRETRDQNPDSGVALGGHR